jgi:Uma2 family endonuclease
MTTFAANSRIEYPDSDGEPMAESDSARAYLTYCVEALDIYFQSRPGVYVSGNLFIYYCQGDPSAVVAPDVFVAFGVSKRQRRSYQLWREGNKVPAFVLEITSATTKSKDEIDKPRLYAQLGVQEYFQYDPTGDYLKPQLKGFTLVSGEYQPISPTSPTDSQDSELCLHSQALGLNLCLQMGATQSLRLSEVDALLMPRELRLYDPQTGEKLLSHRETEQARLEAEQARLAESEARAQAEQACLAESEARSQAEQARLTAVPRLLQMGLTPEQVAEALGLGLDDVMSCAQE